jgi:hypothetical protein
MRKSVCILLFCLVSLPYLKAQTTAWEPLSVWTQIGVEKKITKNLSANLTGQTRFAEGASYLKLYFIDGGLSYELPANFYISGSFRYFEGKKNENKEFKARRRWYGEVGHSFKVGKIKVENALRYQTQNKADDEGVYAFDASYLRYKPEIALSTKSKLKPAINTTFFYNLENKQLDGIRPRAEISYKLNKSNAVTVAFQADYDLTNTSPSTPILVLGYKLKF